jgi:carboxylesterase type B
LSVKTVEQARQVSSSQLITATALQLAQAPYGTFIYGPTVDGDFVPKLPTELLQNGNFATDVKLLIGHNSDEGLLFTNPNSVNASTFEANVHSFLPGLSQADLNYINSALYPGVFNGSAGYTNDVARQAAAIVDNAILCNAYALAKYTSGARLYEFAVSPGVHGTDISYTFYNGPANPPQSSRRIKRQGAAVTSYDLAAISLQDWIESFIETGVPTSSNGLNFPTYGSKQNILKLVSDTSGPVAAKDDVVVSRCTAWLNRLFPDAYEG